MSDLRDRIAAVIYNSSDEYSRKLMVRPDCPGASDLEGDGKPVCYVWADAVIAALGLRMQKGSFNDEGYHGEGPNYPIPMRRWSTQWEIDGRRCERCRQMKPFTDFPEPHEGSDKMRPFCISCTAYIEWATS